MQRTTIAIIVAILASMLVTGFTHTTPALAKAKVKQCKEGSKADKKADKKLNDDLVKNTLLFAKVVKKVPLTSCKAV